MAESMTLTIPVNHVLTDWHGKEIEAEGEPPTIGSKLLSYLQWYQPGKDHITKRILADRIARRIGAATSAGTDYIAGEGALGILREAWEQAATRAFGLGMEPTLSIGQVGELLGIEPESLKVSMVGIDD
jgi:hypothetical protein